MGGVGRGLSCVQLMQLTRGFLDSATKLPGLALRPFPPPPQFWEVIFAVAVCDTLLRYLAVLLKVRQCCRLPRPVAL